MRKLIIYSVLCFLLFCSNKLFSNDFQKGNRLAAKEELNFRFQEEGITFIVTIEGEMIVRYQGITLRNGQEARIRRTSNVKLKYHPINGHIQAIGGKRIIYFPFDDRLKSIGGVNIRYEPFDDRIRSIGSVGINYHPFNHRIKEIGGMRISYDLNGNIEEIMGKIK